MLNDEKPTGRPSHATLLVELALEQAELWHTPEGEPCVTYPEDGHSESALLNSQDFREWLLSEYFERHAKAVTGQAVKDALSMLSARARRHGDRYPAFRRVGRAGDAIYLDLGDPKWRAVEITHKGWTVLSNPPIKFLRSKGMASLPVPVNGGSIDELAPFLPPAIDEDGWILTVSWLLMCYNPNGPYPVMDIHGEQGSGKSFMSKALLGLIDPPAEDLSFVKLEGIPKTERVLAVTVHNRWVVAMDNLSRIPDSISDALCRYANGGGYVDRKLWTDSEEIRLGGARPFLFTGIDSFITGTDLQDRAVTHYLPALKKGVAERLLWLEYEEARPRILGALLNAVSTALRNLDEVELENPARMIDFEEWVNAAESALPWDEGAFSIVYSKSRHEAVSASIEDIPVAQAITELMSDHDGLWTGTTSGLLKELGWCVEESVKRTDDWPKTARKMGSDLRRLEPVLRTVDINVTRRERSGKPTILKLKQEG